MIQKSLRGVLQRNIRNKQGVLATQSRAMGGGEKKPNMPATETNFDVIIVGGGNATALTKHLQTDDPGWKMALVASHIKYVIPQAYFGVSHGHIAPLKLLSQSVSAQVDGWSRTDVGARVVKFLPNENKVVLSNGREHTYKALVLAPGLDHRESHIEGLPEMASTHESENVFVHVLEDKERVHRNYYHGWNHTHGDMICYDPKTPHKGEGMTFWALYYESILRNDKTHGRASANARIQYWTPNKEIFKFPYANEIALDECHKRGVDVMLGWEMIKVHQDGLGQKIATFKNVDTGETLEHPFNHANINPPATPHAELVEAGLTGSDGMIDVNPYTLQHERFPNVFAFGDAISGNTTRTQSAAIAQHPVVKHNLKAFMNGQELNGIYDGFSSMPFYLSHSHANVFSHLWDYEPATWNHWVPSYGLFAKQYFNRQMASNLGAGEKLMGMKKNNGPPHFHFNADFDPLHANEYLLRKQVDIEALKSGKVATTN